MATARAPSGRSRTSPRWCWTTSVSRGRAADCVAVPILASHANGIQEPFRRRPGCGRGPVRRRDACVTVCAGPRTGFSSCASRSSAAPATSSTWPSTRRSSRSPTSHYIVAAVLAFCVAVTNNFLLNRHWTFRAADGSAAFQAPRFLTVSLIALGFNLLVLELLVGVVGVHKIPAQAAAVLAATPLNFVGNKLWSFRTPDAQAGPRCAARRLEPRVELSRAATSARRGGWPLRCVGRTAGPADALADRSQAVRPSDQLVRPASQTKPPADHELSARQAIRVAERSEKLRNEVGQAPAPPARGLHERSRTLAGQLLRAATRSSRRRSSTSDSRDPVEVWTGPQVAWQMARGLPGAFGRKVNAPYIWIPLMIAFIVPFIDWRRPLRLLHLDLLVLLVVLALARLLQPRRDLHVGPARLSRARISARADAAVRVRAAASGSRSAACGYSFRSPTCRWR